MASSRQNTDIPTEILSSDFLTCPLCFDMYKSPKVLPCQHTFCLTCLRQYVASRGFASTLPCPMCKEVTRIPQNDVAQLKNNFTIVNLLQCVEDSWKIASEKSATASASKNQSSEESTGFSTECGACSESKDLISYCEICDFWLCITCTTSHKRVPVTSQHALKTNKEIEEKCKGIANSVEPTVKKLKEVNEDKTEVIFGHIEKLPAMMEAIQSKIKSVSDEACQHIRGKEKELLNRLESFIKTQSDTFSTRLNFLEDQNCELSRIVKVVNDIKISSDGPQNLTNATAIEKDIAGISLLSDFPSNFQSMSFVPYASEKCELQHMNLGSLRIIKDICDEHIFLKDHRLHLHKIASLSERVYITGIAVNKFAEKFVVANNESVFVMQPHCQSPETFLPFQNRGHHMKKPWGIAYCETGKTLYITMAGDHEGEGAVYMYNKEGTSCVVLASGLTLPRGIALHNRLLYVCDQIDRCVYILNSNGSILRVLKKLPDGNFLFNQPMFVSVGSDGRIAVSDGYQSVKIFNNQFDLIYTYHPNFANSELWDVLVLHDGTTIVCDLNNGLHKISRDFRENGLIAVESGENVLIEPSALSSLENGNVIYVGNGIGQICSVI